MTVMADEASKSPNPETKVSTDEVERVLEVGRLLLSVLTPEELEALGSLGRLFHSNSLKIDFSSAPILGNTGVT